MKRRRTKGLSGGSSSIGIRWRRSRLSKLAAEGRWVVTILRTEQYHGLAAFSDVGAFLPLTRDRAGRVTREVAPARFQLSLPEQPGQFLPLAVALIRDWRAQVPVPLAEEARPSYRYPPKDAQGRGWWMEGWEPTPSPRAPTEPKLIPIVTTAPEADPVELAQLYRRRWPVQENMLKDWLLPLGLDTNHGFAKTPVENSEVAKRREALERRLANIQRWARHLPTSERSGLPGWPSVSDRKPKPTETRSTDRSMATSVNMIGVMSASGGCSTNPWSRPCRPRPMRTWTRVGAAMSGCGTGKTEKRPSTHVIAWSSVISCVPWGS
jgi:hypothetical protein